ncbi:MAG: SDR family NAD(P)-dependent oxidoreductase [Xanthomonadales bacterium]|nr:SDR family NAD(P)-dependent oxidoreductase [Xanthomonadales bacterium]
MNSGLLNSTRDYLASLFDLSGKTALVTGGGSGIGLMMTRALVSAGARVLIASRKLEACQQTVDSLDGLPGSCVALQADLQNEEGVNSLAASVAQHCEKLHILVNNSGRSWGAPLEQFPWKAWNDVMTLNVTAPFTLTRQLLPLLSLAATREQPARVINIGSVMGTMPQGFPAYSYAASKAALHHVTRILANELADQHIAVNAIAPGPFPSNMTAFFIDNENASEAVRNSVPLKRLGMEPDIAGLILCLCGAGGAYISGAIIPLDGGMTAYRSPGIGQGIEGMY